MSQAKAFAKSTFYPKGAQIVPTNAAIAGFHVCVVEHVAGMTPPPANESTSLWHWSTDMSLLK